MSKDYYKVLGLEKSASQDQIKSAYKKLAVKHHPDVNKEGGAEEKFKEVNEAYQVLSDPQKKANYDQFGSADMGGGNQGWGGFSAQGGPASGWDFGGFSNGGFDGLDDILGSFFSGGRSSRRQREQRGSDVEIIIELDFKEAVFGVEKNIAYSVMGTCEECKGKGGTGLKKCGECNGSGFVTRTTRTILGSFAQTAPCQRCKGKGEIPENTCRRCGGSGRTRQTRNLNVKIPAGVSDGSAIRVGGGGEAGADGNGDLYLRIKTRPSKEFRREGYDIHNEVEIPYLTAVLGDKIDIMTVDGPVRLSIPAGTESHSQFKLKERGVPVPNQRNRRGDHYVLVKIKVPKRLTREEREALEKLKDSEG